MKSVILTKSLRGQDLIHTAKLNMYKTTLMQGKIPFKQLTDLCESFSSKRLFV